MVSHDLVIVGDKNSEWLQSGVLCSRALTKYGLITGPILSDVDSNPAIRYFLYVIERNPVLRELALAMHTGHMIAMALRMALKVARLGPFVYYQ